MTPRERYIPQGSAKVADKNSSAVAYIYERQNRFLVMAYHGKAAKPDFHYSYRTEKERNSRVAEHFKAWRKIEQRKESRRKERSDFQNPYKVGDLFRQSWGYDQTNINWFECIAVNGKMLTVREIAQERIEDGFMSGKTVPLPGQFLNPRYDGDDQGKPIRCRAREGGIKVGPYRFHWASYQPGKIIAGVKVYNPSYWSSYA